MHDIKIFMCKHCDETWEVSGYEELGVWFPYDEEDFYCGTCDKEGVEYE